MSFQAFCNRIATSELITDQLELPPTVSNTVSRRVDAMCDIMKNKMGILDRIEIPFIESAFDDMDRVDHLMKDFSVDGVAEGNVSDYVLITFSRRLYKKEFHELTVEQQAIIKILSVYICISIQDVKQH